MGRPRMRERDKRVTMCFSLKREEIALLTSVSRQTGRSRSSIVAELIRERLSEEVPKERR